jgi:uncharacterized protein YdhG (YjbR/CyaY superfamily)
VDEYIAGYQHHIGLYPVAGAVGEALEEELRPFKRGKGSVRFPLDHPLPVALVRRIVRLRAGEIEGGKVAGKPKSEEG